MTLCLIPCSAQEKKTEQTQEKAVKKASNVETSGPTSHLSSNLSSSLTSSLPKYAPPPPEPAVTQAADPTIPETGEEEALPEDRPLSPDQPKNKIIRLPKYVVLAERPPIFKEREIYTKSALAKIAMKRYLSSLDTKLLNRWTIPIIGMSAEDRAMMKYREDQRLEDKAELETAARNARISGDKNESIYLKKETEKTFFNSGGMDWRFPKN
jgi:hypothetical protein